MRRLSIFVAIAFVFALSFAATQSAQAQTFNVIYSFPGPRMAPCPRLVSQ